MNIYSRITNSLPTCLLVALLFAVSLPASLAASGADAVARLQDGFDASPAGRKKIYTELIKLGGEASGTDSLGRLVRAVALFQRAMDGEDGFVDRIVKGAPSFRHISRDTQPFLADFRAASAEFGALDSIFPFTAEYAAAARIIAENWGDGEAMCRQAREFGSVWPVSRFTRRILLLAGCRLLLDKKYKAAAGCFQELLDESAANSQARDACRVVEALRGAGGLKLSPEHKLQWAIARGLSGHTDLTELIKRHPESPQAERAYLRIFENINRGFAARTLSHNRRNATLLEKYFSQFSSRYPNSRYMEISLLLRAEFNYRCGKKCQAIARKNDYSWRKYKSNRRHSTARKYFGYAATYFARVAAVDSITSVRYPGSDTRMSAGVLLARSNIERDRFEQAQALLNGLLDDGPGEELAVEIASYAGLICYHEGHYDQALEILSPWAAVRFSAYDGWQRAMLFLGKSHDMLGDGEMTAFTFAVLSRAFPYTYYGIRARLLKHELLKDVSGIIPWVNQLPMVQLPRFPDTLSTVGQATDGTAGQWRELGFHAEAAYIYSHGMSLAPEDARLRFRYHENFLDAGLYSRVLRGFRGPFRKYLQQGGLGLPENFWRIAFLNPEENTKTINREGERRGIPPGLITAVMRQESNFHPGAKSHAGAVGLMQLLPSVGRRLARGEGIGSVSTRRLYDPDVNIRLGTKFLASNLKKYKGNIALAISSYNADPRNLPAWMERSHPAGARENGFDLDLFIELIPLEETYYYNIIVLTNYWRYQELGGEGKDLFAWKLSEFSGVN